MTEAQGSRLSGGARRLHDLLDLQPADARRLSQLELGSELGVGARQVRRYLDELEETGLVIRIRGGRGNCSQYELVPCPVIGEVSSPDDRTLKQALDRTSREEYSEAMSGQTLGSTTVMTGHLTGHLTGHPRAGAILAGDLELQENPPPTESPLPSVVPLPVDQESTSQTVVAWFIDEWRSAGLAGPTKRFIGHTAKEIKRTLDEGFSVPDVQAGLARMVERGVMQPSMLGNFVMEAQARTRRPVSVDKPVSRRYGRGMTAAEVLRQAHA